MRRSALTVLSLDLAGVAFVPGVAADHCAGDAPFVGEAYRAGCHFASVVVETGTGLADLAIGIVVGAALCLATTPPASWTSCV